tara:strand:- start:169 stop:855 length:687 start_codon:yes stop_codon:yes gene_type:complete
MKTSQIQTYKINKKLRHHQKVLIDMILKEHGKNFTGDILDIGCAAGTLIKELKKKVKKSNFLGVDTSSELIKIARKKQIPNCKFFKRDFMNLKSNLKFDIIIAGGVLAFYDNFDIAINKMISLLKKNGFLYIIGTFNSENVDTLVKFRNNYTKSRWEKGLNSFSIKTITKYLKRKKLRFQFKKFKIPFLLKKKKNPILSYTIKTQNNSLILINGANIRMELFYLLIKK